MNEDEVDSEESIQPIHRYREPENRGKVEVLNSGGGGHFGNYSFQRNKCGKNSSGEQSPVE